MAISFSDSHKEDSKYFETGVHKVKILSVFEDVNANDKPFFGFDIKGENGETDTARLWFSTDKAIAMSFGVIRDIMVHNAPEGKKDAIRDEINKVKDTDELLAIAQASLKGREAWYEVAQNGTWTNDQGEVKNSYNKNLYGYEKKPKKVTPEMIMGSEPADPNEVPFN